MKEQHFSTTHASMERRQKRKKKKKIMQVTKSELKESIDNVHIVLYNIAIAQVY